MKWHPDKNQGEAFGRVSVSCPCSNTRMQILPALGMCCMKIYKTIYARAG